MKFRKDFVTNSSSSSFIISQKGDFTKEQKEKMVEFVVNHFIKGRYTEEIINETQLKHYAEENGWYDGNQIDDYYKEDYDRILNAVRNGETVYVGSVSFEETEYQMADLYEKIWESLEETDEFNVIDGDLSY